MNIKKTIEIFIAGVALLVCLALIIVMPVIDAKNDQDIKIQAEKEAAAEAALRERIAEKWSVKETDKKNAEKTPVVQPKDR